MDDEFHMKGQPRMSHSSSHPVTSISPDRPVTTLDEDALDRGGFAIALANAFIQWQGEDSLVVALYGPYGSGKTSIKNMILDLVNNQEDGPITVEFNPWAWSGRNELFVAFFEEIGIAIDKKVEQKVDQEIVSKWRRYGARLAYAGSAFGLAKYGTSLLGIPLVPIIAEKTQEAMEHAQKAIDAKADLLDLDNNQESLEDMKLSLSKSLRHLPAPLIVILDDVDRLTHEEIRLLFQLIKVNADFPKVVYFLLFDRAKIEDALFPGDRPAGRVYMEKIVQAGFDIPRHDHADMYRLLIKGLKGVLGFDEARRSYDDDRWGELYRRGLRYLLRTPRDVNRLVSSLSFTVGVFYRNGMLEVNTIDLVAVEALRVFEPEVYHQLPLLKSVLLDHVSPNDIVASQDKGVAAKNFIEGLPVERRAWIQAIIGELFPRFNGVLNGFVRSGSEQAWLKALRICHKDVFDRYFALGVPRNDISLHKIYNLLKAVGSKTTFVEKLQEFAEVGKLSLLTTKLVAYLEDIPQESIPIVVEALMDVGDSFDSLNGGWLGLGPDLEGCFFLGDLLARVDSDEDRSSILLSAMSATEGMYIATKMLQFDLHRKKKMDPRRPPFLSDADRLEAAEVCLRKLRSAANDSQLLGSKLSTYLWCWSELSGDGEPRRYVASLLSTQEGASDFVRSLMRPKHSSSSFGEQVIVGHHVDQETLRRFAPLEILRRLFATPLSQGDLAGEYANRFHDERSALEPVFNLDQSRWTGGPVSSEPDRIDVNEASADELVVVLGIDRGSADLVVSGRPYTSLDDIARSGLSSEMLDYLKDWIRVSVDEADL